MIMSSLFSSHCCFAFFVCMVAAKASHGNLTCKLGKLRSQRHSIEMYRERERGFPKMGSTPTSSSLIACSCIFHYKPSILCATPLSLSLYIYICFFFLICLIAPRHGASRGSKTLIRCKQRKQGWRFHSWQPSQTVATAISLYRWNMPLGPSISVAGRIISHQIRGWYPSKLEDVLQLSVDWG